MPSQKDDLSFRLISIEPLESLQGEVRKIATEHGFQLQSEGATAAIAPFCGHSYFSQEMTLSNCTSEFDVLAKLEKCIAALEHLTDTAVADGYIEYKYEFV